MSKKITINDIANELGLSRNTVSKVFNGKKVPPKTKQLIIEKAKEMNYKQISDLYDDKDKSYNILLLSGKPLTNINFFIPIISAIENACFENKHQYFQFVCRENSEQAINNLFDYVENIHIDGIICIETFLQKTVEKILTLNIPTIFVDFVSDCEINGHFDIIGVENAAPIKKIVRLMAEKGKKTFSFVGDIKHCLSFKERYEAMLVGILENHLPEHHLSDDLLLPDNLAGYHSPSELSNYIDINNIKDVYICANDFIARNLILFFQSKNIRVPEDVSIIGFDNSSLSRNSHPIITTVSCPQTDLGLNTLSLLLDRIENPHKQNLKVMIGTELIFGESNEN